jgi:hypothetical protein
MTHSFAFQSRRIESPIDNEKLLRTSVQRLNEGMSDVLDRSKVSFSRRETPAIASAASGSHKQHVPLAWSGAAEDQARPMRAASPGLHVTRMSTFV